MSATRGETECPRRNTGDQVPLNSRQRRSFWLVGLTLILVAAAYVPTAWTWGVPTHKTWAIDTLFDAHLAGWAWYGAQYREGFTARYPPVLRVVYGVATYPVFQATVALTDAPAKGDTIEYHTYRYSQMLRWAQLVNLAFGLATIALIARLGWCLHSPEAGVLAAAFWSSLPLVGYYNVATNADVPYVFWTLLAFERVLAWHRRRTPWKLVASAVAAALSVGTKDQAAALVVTIPLLIAWPPFRPAGGVGASGNRLATRFRSVAVWSAVALPAYALASAMVLDPHGYVRHVRMLFDSGLAGYQKDSLTQLAATYGGYITATGWWPVLLAMAVGSAFAVWKNPRIAAWLAAPVATFTLVFIVGSRLGFHRFLLPHFAVISLLAGVGFGRWWQGRRWESPVLTVAVVILAVTGWSAALLMSRDPRGQADRWLAEHAEVTASASVIETIPTYLPTRLQLSPPVQVLLPSAVQPCHEPPPAIDTRFLIVGNSSRLRSLLKSPDPEVAGAWRRLYEKGPPDSTKVAEFEPPPLPLWWDHARRRPLGVSGLYQTIRVFALPPATAPDDAGAGKSMLPDCP